MKFQGKVTNWNDDKGYGFVEPNGGGDRAFVHIKAFSGYSRRPVEGDLITYTKQKQSDGRFKAVDVKLVRDRHLSKNNKKNSRKLGSFVTLVFCMALAALVVTEQLPLAVLYIYVGASVVTYLAYALDKSAAQKQRWRTRESTLHLFALVGGWPGAFYAQNKLRHKSKKAEFKSVFWGTVLLNIGAFSWLLSADGRLFLIQALG